jgi:hypothetical protein
MICFRCTTELPAMATACPECGSSVPQGQSTTFSYLPPGAPPWPMGVPEKLPYLVESKAGEAFTARTKPHLKLRSQPGALARRIISIVLILLITPTLGVLATIGVLAIQGRLSPNSHTSASSLLHLPGASNNANPFSGSAVLPPPAAFKIVGDTSMNISLQCPSDWTAGPVDQSSDPIEYPITQPGHLILIHISRFSNSSSSQISGPDQLNIQLMGLMSQTFSNVKSVVSPNAEPIIGNDRWMEQDATYTDTNNNVESHFATITVLHDRQNYYNINFAVPQSVYQQAMQQYIQPILGSLQFIS